MERVLYDTVILSDLHLGSEVARAAEALSALQAMTFSRLILLGDIFCDLNFRRLTKDHWRFLSYIRKLSNPKRGVEVVWVEGNHDHGLAQLMSHLVGVPVFKEYRWEHAGEKLLAIHGHQFDAFVSKNRFGIANVFGGPLFLLLQKLDGKTKPLSRFVDRLNTRWLRLTTKVANGAMAHARWRGATRVFCGHTHEAGSAERNGIHYYNTGCWTTERPTYITISEREITIHEYVDGVDHCHTSQERRKAASATAGIAGEPGLSEDGGYEGAYC